MWKMVKEHADAVSSGNGAGRVTNRLIRSSTVGFMTQASLVVTLSAFAFVL